jgi:chromosome segregation ATPase
MKPLFFALSLLAAPALAQDDPQARIAELEAQVAAQAETIAALEEALAARLDETELGTLQARLRNQTLRIATLESDLTSCRRARQDAEDETRRVRSETARLDSARSSAEARVQRLEADLRRAEQEARRAESDVRRLRSDLRRCR